MPKIQNIQTNLTAGELSERLKGRVDISRYQNGADKVRNCYPVVQGGARRRPGFRYIKPAKPGDFAPILVPFVFNKTQAYILEFGNLYMRVFRNRAQVLSGISTYELVTPFTSAILRELTYTQRADTMFIAHSTLPIQRLRRFDHNFWSIEAAPFDPLPYDEVGFRPVTSLTLSSTGVGTGVSLTAGGGVFLNADLGREIWAGPGVAKITGLTDALHATAQIIVPFASTLVDAGNWQLRDSPIATCTPSVAGPVGAAVTLTLDTGGWRPTDVGSHVVINSGLVLITAYTSSTVLTGTIQTVLGATVGSPPTAWSLETPIWNTADGYPRAVGLYQQALYAAGTKTTPNGFWRSKVGDVLGFSLGLNDSDAFDYTLDSNEENEILHIYPVNRLLMLTAGGGFAIYGGVEKAIAPTNIQADNDSDNGSSQVRPVRVGKELVYAHASGTALQSLNYDYSADAFQDSELSVLSSHLTELGIVDMAFQQKPEKLLWIVLADGSMASVTIDREQQVIGWALHTTDGQFESVATIPGLDGNEVWCVIARTINGQVIRNIEALEFGLNTDAAVTGTNEAGASTWGGLSHLEGKEVAVKGDGANLTRRTVVGGQITVERLVYSIEIGEPYSHQVKTLPPELAGGGGTVQGTNQSINKVTLRLLETVSAMVNGQYIDFRQFGSHLLDQPPPVFTGDYPIETIGWSRGVQLDITSDLPFDWHLLAVIVELTVNS